MSKPENSRVMVAAAIAAVIMASLAVTFHGGIAEAKHKKQLPNLPATYYIAWQQNPDLRQFQGKSKTLWVNDTVIFKYDPQFYNVIPVDKDSYDSCSPGGRKVDNTGNDQYPLRHGWQYFICGVNYSGYSDCSDYGMKVGIFAHIRP